jgi:precorrin isomerase
VTTSTVGEAITVKSDRILAERVDLSGFGPLARPVVARVVHATADVDFASDMVVADDDVAAGVAALRAGAAVVTDVEMVRHGITGVAAHCYLGSASAGPESTRSAAGMRLAAASHPVGAIVVVGCAPTALEEVLRLHRDEGFTPALVVGLPVGFVGAAEAKEHLRRSGLRAISNRGEKGGSAVAAAALNAMARLAGETS